MYSAKCNRCGMYNQVSVMDIKDHTVHGVFKCGNPQCPDYMDFREVSIPLGSTATKEDKPRVCLLCGVPLGRRAGEWKMSCRPSSYKAKKEKLMVELVQELSQGLDYIEDNRHEVHAKLLALARIL